MTMKKIIYLYQKKERKTYLYCDNKLLYGIVQSQLCMLKQRRALCSSSNSSLNRSMRFISWEINVVFKLGSQIGQMMIWQVMQIWKLKFDFHQRLYTIQFREKSWEQCANLTFSEQRPQHREESAGLNNCIHQFLHLQRMCPR